MLSIKDIKLGVIGLGYVGLPLALKFATKRKVVAHDLSKLRISQLKNNFDSTKEMARKDFIKAKNIKFTSNINDLKNCNCFIVAVPTPVNNKNFPDLNNLVLASKNVAKILKKKDIVIYESTVYPGATREVCVKILEKISNLKFNQDFFVGYSPERINPGDKKHTLENIVKITSGSNLYALNITDKLYKSIVRAGTCRVDSIEIAEAAKVIENTQRDLNIALINELSIIFNKMNLSTRKVLAAAGTKWNFLNFKPGLVGGHCIGVDPYYLTYKSNQIGYKAKIILAGRKLNDSMPSFIVSSLKKKMTEKKINFKNAKILILGLTFKENCSDIRNSKVFDIYYKLKKLKILVDCYDPFVDKQFLKKHKNLKKINYIKKNYYDGLIVAVPHQEFINKGEKYFKEMVKKNSVIFDVKSIFSENFSDISL